MKKYLLILLITLLIPISAWAIPPFLGGSSSSGFAKSLFTAYPEATDVTADDLLLITDDPAGTPTSKKITANTLFSTAGYLWPGSYGTTGQLVRSSGTAVPAWSTATFADTYAKGTFLYNASANAVDALPHPGAANYIMTTLAADTAGWLASSADVISLLGSASTSAFRTAAGLEIGTNVQAYSGILLGIAETTPAAGILGYTGSGYDWFTGIALSNNSLRHFYDETAGYYSNTDCTAEDVPADCCTGEGTGTCAPKTVGIDPVGMTAGKSAKFAFQNTDDAIYTLPAATASLAPLASPTFTTPNIGAATGMSLSVTGTLSGKIPTVVNSDTASYTVTQAHIQACTFFITTNAATTTYNLPAAEAGGCACFKMGQGNAQILRIDTDGSDYIVKPTGARTTAAGDYYGATSSAANQICVVAFDTTDWYVTSEVGVWAEE